MTSPTPVMHFSLVAFCLLAVALDGAHGESSMKRQTGLCEVKVQEEFPAANRPVTVKERVDSLNDARSLR